MRGRFVVLLLITLATVVAGLYAFLRLKWWQASEAQRSRAEPAAQEPAREGKGPSSSSDSKPIEPPRDTRYALFETAPAVSEEPSEEALDDLAPDGSARFRAHPVTPESEKLMAQRFAFEDVKGALKARDFEKARHLLRENRAKHGADVWQDFQEGFEVIVDCLESPSPDTRSRAESFIAANRASMVRRRVRRACLSGS